MHFLLTAYDGTDDQALERRMKVREAHLEKLKVLRRKGEFKFGGAILDEEGNMIGSAIVYEFPDRKALDRALQDEPYYTGGVWKQIEIKPFRLANIG